jgi:hypothetical protein
MMTLPQGMKNDLLISSIDKPISQPKEKKIQGEDGILNNEFDLNTEMIQRAGFKYYPSKTNMLLLVFIVLVLLLTYLYQKSSRLSINYSGMTQMAQYDQFEYYEDVKNRISSSKQSDSQASMNVSEIPWWIKDLTQVSNTKVCEEINSFSTDFWKINTSNQFLKSPKHFLPAIAIFFRDEDDNGNVVKECYKFDIETAFLIEQIPEIKEGANEVLHSKEMKNIAFSSLIENFEAKVIESLTPSAPKSCFTLIFNYDYLLVLYEARLYSCHIVFLLSDPKIQNSLHYKNNILEDLGSKMRGPLIKRFGKDKKNIGRFVEILMKDINISTYTQDFSLKENCS